MIPANPKGKTTTKNYILNGFKRFTPTECLAVTDHSFLTTFAEHEVDALPEPISFNLRTKYDIREKRGDAPLKKWVKNCIGIVHLQKYGRARQPIRLSKNSSCEEKHLDDKGIYRLVSVNYAFVYDGEVAAMMVCKAVGTINLDFWRGRGRGDECDWKLTRELRSCVKNFFSFSFSFPFPFSFSFFNLYNTNWKQ